MKNLQKLLTVAFLAGSIFISAVTIDYVSAQETSLSTMASPRSGEPLIIGHLTVDHQYPGDCLLRRRLFRQLSGIDRCTDIGLKGSGSLRFVIIALNLQVPNWLANNDKMHV